jgi:hypothetical protein
MAVGRDDLADERTWRLSAALLDPRGELWPGFRGEFCLGYACGWSSSIPMIPLSQLLFEILPSVSQQKHLGALHALS